MERCPLREGAAGPWSFARIPQFRRMGAFICIIEHRSLSHHYSSTPSSTRISLIAGNMSQPVVQTIHRDPALLYVGLR